MLIYNVTIKIETAIAADWLSWMKTIHIPEVMETGCFTKYQMVRLLDTDETDGLTYAVQYYAAGAAEHQRYLTEFAPLLRQKTIDKWQSKMIAFRSLMEIV